MTIAAKTDRALIRARASSSRYVLLRVTAPVAGGTSARLAVNVALVVDRSGSMDGDSKFPLAVEATERALKPLDAADRFSVIVFDNSIDVVHASSPASPEAKREALRRLQLVAPRGSTNLGGGWLAGCEQVASQSDGRAVARCLLLTDGLANEGITSREELCLHAGELRSRGVGTTTFGVGEDFDELLLRDMARDGGGNFYFIESSEQIPAVIARELGEQMEVTMPGAVIDISLPEGVVAQVLHQFRATIADDGRKLSVSLGDLVSGQEVVCVLRLTFPQGTEGAEVAASVTMRSGSTTSPVAAAPIRLTWTYATHEANDLQRRDVDVDREVARIYAARARAEASEANRRGDYSRAIHVVERVARRISAYAGTDTTLKGIVGELRSAAIVFESPLSPMALKEEVFASYLTMSSRSPTGFARRTPDAEDRADGA